MEEVSWDWSHIPPSSCPVSLWSEEALLLVFETVFSFLYKGTLELAKQVSNLPQANYNLLRYICR